VCRPAEQDAAGEQQTDDEADDPAAGDEQRSADCSHGRAGAGNQERHRRAGAEAAVEQGGDHRQRGLGGEIDRQAEDAGERHRPPGVAAERSDECAGG
jgi:hypothetical protein